MRALAFARGWRATLPMRTLLLLSHRLPLPLPPSGSVPVDVQVPVPAKAPNVVVPVVQVSHEGTAKLFVPEGVVASTPWGSVPLVAGGVPSFHEQGPAVPLQPIDDFAPGLQVPLCVRRKVMRRRGTL